MKIFLKAYFRKNLGDDLFVYILCKRYPNITFSAISTTKYNLKLDNLKIIWIKNKVQKLINKYILKEKKLDYYIAKRNEYTVVIGGSMFIENNNSNESVFLGLPKKFFILGSNFGPYYSEEFYDKYKKVFANAIDVSFRDSYSYSLFKNLNNVRYNPDIVFSLDNSIECSTKKNVVISVIDCSSRKEILVSNHVYESKIVELIMMFIKKGYTITLMSFCKAEGDERVVKRILKKLNKENCSSKIKKFFYNGNINQALNIIKSSEIIVGTRFHACVLGLLYEKTVIPIIYSNKTENLLNDLNFQGLKIRINNINNLNPNKIDNSQLSYKLNVEGIKEKALKHFEKLDKIVGENNDGI